MLALLLDDADDALATLGDDLLADGEPGVLLALAEVADGTEAESSLPPALSMDDRDAGPTAALIAAPMRRGVGVGDRDAVGLLVDGGLDELGLLRGVGVVGLLSSMLSLAAAASAPLRMLSQNVSPGAWW